METARCASPTSSQTSRPLNIDRPLVRHNSCFLHPHGPPNSTLPDWVPDRHLLSDCRYHDMVKETVGLKGSQDLERLRRHVEEVKPAREAEQAEFTRSRFQRQHETAAYWENMQEAFREARGFKSAVAAAPSNEAAPSPGQALPSSPPAARSMLQAAAPSTPTRSVATPLRSAAYMAPSSSGSRRAGEARRSQMSRSGSDPLQAKKARIVAGRLYQDGGRGRGRVGVGYAGPNDFVPFEQEPGSRGLPPDFTPAKSSHLNFLIWERNRSHTISGLRARGWD